MEKFPVGGQTTADPAPGTPSPGAPDAGTRAPHSPLTVDNLEALLRTRLQVGAVKILGARRTNPDFVRSIIQPWMRGETFSEIVDNLSVAVERLRKTDAFKGVDMYLDESVEPNKTDVTLTLAEHALYSIRAGTEFGGSVDASSVNASLHLRNLFGRAESLSAKLASGGGALFSLGSSGGPDAIAETVKNPSARGTIEFRKPFLAGKDVDLAVRIDRGSTNELKYSAYQLTDQGAEVEVSTKFGTWTYAGRWRYLQPDSNAAAEVREMAGDSIKSSIKYSYGVDARDSATMPREGTAANVQVEVAGLGGDARFMKQEVAVQGHIPVGEVDATLSLGLRAGTIFPLDKKVYIQDRFFLGADSFRGFERRGVGPHAGTASLGGEVYYAAIASLSLPLPQKSPLRKLFDSRVHFFAAGGDICSLSDAREAVKKAKGTPSALFERARVSVGLGLIVDLPIGRLEANLCHVVKKAANDKDHGVFQLGFYTEYS